MEAQSEVAAGLPVLYQNDHFIVVDKPQGFYVHPPEHRGRSQPIDDSLNCMKVVKAQLGGQWVYPVHRLDRRTSGVLIYALTKLAASRLSEQFRENWIKKEYFAIVRGHLKGAGKIDVPLKKKQTTGMIMDAVTQYAAIAEAELPFAVGRYQTVRYSLVRACPETGRFHQIRRHLKFLGYPIIGDRQHGDRDQNLFFENEFKLPQMFLRAKKVEFWDPFREEGIVVEAGWTKEWQEAFRVFNWEASV
jgi:tRNA pseudouridine65 synthase